MNIVVEKLFKDFVKENPYADNLELAEYFYNKGKEMGCEATKALADLKAEEAKLPKYYGD